MGFRDIHAFNLAMLAKQAWRILHKTHSLFYCMYKTRYFPSCSFMDAELGASPSVVWRSLLQAQEVIREGSIWQVGNGQTIGINTHRWLPRPPTFNNGADKSLKVAGLIDANTNQWDRAKVHAIFDSGTREDILPLKLGNMTSRDRLIWKENKAKKFLVKTAYRVALRLHHPQSREPSQARLDQKMWKKIWFINIPPKVQTFIWRACSNILPTKANLLRKKVQVDPTCSVCGQHEETTGHILWECPLARKVWALVRGSIQKTSSLVPNFFLLTRQMMERLSGKEFELWAMIAWALWNARNRIHFQHTQTHPTEILKQATKLMMDYQKLV